MLSDFWNFWSELAENLHSKIVNYCTCHRNMFNIWQSYGHRFDVLISLIGVVETLAFLPGVGPGAEAVELMLNFLYHYYVFMGSTLDINSDDLRMSCNTNL